MNLTDIKHLFSYTEWANNLVLEAAKTLPDESLRQDVGISHKSIFETLLHMAGADWIWLERWRGGSPARDQAWKDWTIESCPDLGMLKQRWTTLIDQRSSYVSELDEATLA